MIIDGHAHAKDEFADPNRLFRILENLKVDKVVLCPGGGDPHGESMKPRVKESLFTTNPRILFWSNYYLKSKTKNAKNRDLGNEYVHSLVKNHPDKLIQYYWLNFNDPDFLQKLKENYTQWRFKGIKLHQCIVPFKTDSKVLDLTSNFAAVNNLPIFIHIYNRKEAIKLIELMRKYKTVNYTIAHMMGLEEVIKFGKDLTNVYFDTSTYYIVSKKRIEKAITYFGADHIIMGSDSPFGYDNLQNIIRKIRSLDLSQEEKDLIMGGNIARLLKL
ncbi:MAG: amidohydrolase family protein [Candidatus Heimdallarchaeota archaeon]|nr:amidohydrolase family protein [Candidatus Heimdallarchaeota archaeon]